MAWGCRCYVYSYTGCVVGGIINLVAFGGEVCAKVTCLYVQKLSPPPPPLAKLSFIGGADRRNVDALTVWRAQPERVSSR